MTKRTWIILFATVLIVNITAGLLNNRWLEYISKPVIVISIVAIFVSQTAGNPSPLKKWILLALLFSWIGDILLMFQANDTLFFLLGLSSFLLAHVCYIIFFQNIRQREKTQLKPVWLLIVLAYYLSFVTFLFPHLLDMKLPVIVYGAVISSMLSLATGMLSIRDKQAGRWMMCGALLFVISDSVLALNQFYESFRYAGAIVMLTYSLSQLFITEGAIKYNSNFGKL